MPRSRRCDQHSYMQLQQSIDAVDTEQVTAAVSKTSVTEMKNLRMRRPFREADRGHRCILGAGWDPRLSLRCRVASASDGSYPADALLC